MIRPRHFIAGYITSDPYLSFIRFKFRAANAVFVVKCEISLRIPRAVADFTTRFDSRIFHSRIRKLTSRFTTDVSRLTPSEAGREPREICRSNFLPRQIFPHGMYQRRQSLRSKWHLSSGLSMEILLYAPTDLPSINAATATKEDGSLRGRERGRDYSVDFRDTPRLPRGSGASSRKV